MKVYHTVRKWIYIGHKLSRTFDSSLSIYDINAYKKCLEKLIWTKKKIMFLKRVLNLRPLWSGLIWPGSNEKCQACCQLSYWGTCIIMLQNRKKLQCSCKFDEIKNKNPIFEQFPPISSQRDYAKLILLKKCNFYHKINFLQHLETTSPIDLFGCNFANLGNFISISSKSCYFCIFYS